MKLNPETIKSIEKSVAARIGALRKNVFVNGCLQIDQLSEGNLNTIHGTVPAETYIRAVDQWYFENVGGDSIITAQQVKNIFPGLGYAVEFTVAQANTTPGSTNFSGFETGIEPQRFSDWGWGTPNALPASLEFQAKCTHDLKLLAAIGDYGNSQDAFLHTFQLLSNQATTCRLILPPATDPSTQWADGGFYITLVWGSAGTTTPELDQWITGSRFNLYDPASYPNNPALITQLNDIAGAHLWLGGFNLVTGDNPVAPAQPTYIDDLAECERYTEKSYAIGVVPGTITSNAIGTGSGNPDAGGYVYYTNDDNIAPLDVIFPYHRPKLASPTVALFSPTTGNRDKVDYVKIGTGWTADGDTTDLAAGTKYARVQGPLDSIGLSFHYVVDNPY